VVSLLDATIFGAPFQIDGRAVRVSCRVGVARFPADGEDGGTLLHKAEAALRHAKSIGERYLHYRLEMRSEISERLMLEHRLREAIDHQQFELHYQPQVNIASGRIESVEALLRWNAPGEGLVPPARFLPTLEASGLIVPVGEWVVRRAEQDLRRWQQLGLGPVRIAVNVSAMQIRRRRFIDCLLGSAAVSAGDAPGYGIDMEITESALLQDPEGAGRLLRELRAAGVRVALDDFGTGYSSLGLLTQLPVDVLKIDRGFVRGLPGDSASMALTQTIIRLAAAFGLCTVAEGVETSAQLEALRELGCDMSQGFFHHPPAPVTTIEGLLTAASRA
ncbi:MAG: putative bifunctional diguanylate cyclase/phosphodiesterase, partial [Steroidobacteraceae bacterium]